MGNSIHCDKIRDLLPDYHSGVLNQQDRTLVQHHLLSCVECSLELVNLIEADSSLSRFSMPYRSFDDYLRMRFLGPSWERVKEEHQKGKPEASQQYAAILQAFSRIVPFLVTRTRGPAFRSRGVVTRGGFSEVVIAKVLNDLWEPTEETVRFTLTSGPRITREGDFEMTLETKQTEYEGRNVVCSFLIGTQRMILAGPLERQDSTLRTSIIGDGFPAREEFEIPFDRHITLYVEPPDS